MYQEKDSVFESNGATFDLNFLFRETEHLPIRTIKTADLAWVLAFVNDIDEARVQAADIRVPILVTNEGDKELVVDGLHRLVHAIRMKKTTLPYKRVSSELMHQALIHKPYSNSKNPAFLGW